MTDVFLTPAFRRAARLLVLALATALLLPAAAPAAAPFFGFNDNSVVRGELTPAEDAAILARAGANSVRISIEWDWIQRTRGPLQMGGYDQHYRALLAQGIRPLITVSGAPRWTWPVDAVCADDSCHYAHDRTYNGAWYFLVRHIAQRYPRAAAIEVWNEPNLGIFFAGGPDPVRYTELLRLAYNAVKSVQPDMPVLGGALAPDLGEEKTSEHWGMRPFLRAMYAAGARDYMDGISLHPYPAGTSEGVSYEAIDQVLAIRDNHGDNAPLWLSEVGVSSTDQGSSENMQAIVLGDLVPRLLRRPDVEGVYVHSLLDRQNVARTEREAGYGMMRTPVDEKPAFCSVATAFGAGDGCSPLQPLAARTAQWDAQEELQAAIEKALAYRRANGSYKGMTAASLGSDPEQLNVLTTPLGAIARLCKTTELRSYCVAIKPWGEFRFRSGSSLDEAIRALYVHYGSGW
jgi:hypothetical protein